MTAPNNITLRQRNAVNLRLAVVALVKEKLRHNTLDNVVIKPLCQELGIATATFFNHFPQKTDILIYFIQLWTVRLEFEALHVTGGKQGKLMIEAMFALLAADIEEHPGLMLEIIAFIARAKVRPVERDITDADLVLAWPDLHGIEKLPRRGLGDVLKENIDLAFMASTPITQKSLELRKRSLFEALVALFYGYPLTVKIMQIDNIEQGLRQQIQLLWHAVDLD